MPALSESLGRKPVAILSISVDMWLLMNTGADASRLLLVVAFTIHFVFGLITLPVGPLSAESVLPTLMFTASGMVVGAGEIIGGGFAPVINCMWPKHGGIQYIMRLGPCAMVL